MEETLITQTTTQAGQKKKKAVKYINPSTTNEQLKGFAQQIVALTTDNFDGASVTSYRTKGEVIFTDKPTPNLVIGSWSATDSIYTAPITYDGDGALSVNVGSISNGSLIIADEDGIFSGVLTASAGESYAPAAFGFSYDTDTVTVSGGGGSSSIPDSIVTALGSQFVPTVNNATDFLDNADDNIIFFDSRLKQFFEAKNDYLLVLDDGFADTPTVITPDSADQNTFRWGAVTISTGSDSTGNSVYIASSADNATMGYGTGNASLDMDIYLLKISETTALIYRPSTKKNGSYAYPFETYVGQLAITSDGAISNSGTIKLMAGLSSLSSDAHKKYCAGAKSCMCPNVVTFILATKSATDKWPSSYVTYYINENGLFQGLDTVTSGNHIGTIRANPNGKDNLDFVAFASQYPAVVEFDGQSVTVSKAEKATTSPFLYTKRRVRNSSGSITGGGDYVEINTGLNKAGTPKRLQLTTISSGVESTLSPWPEDDGYFIHGTYHNKAHTDCYVVTYKPGTYPKSSWLNDAFDVWNVDFFTPRFIKSDKKLPQILKNLVIENEIAVYPLKKKNPELAIIPTSNKSSSTNPIIYKVIKAYSKSSTPPVTIYNNGNGTLSRTVLSASSTEENVWEAKTSNYRDSGIRLWVMVEENDEYYSAMAYTTE